MQPAAIAAHPYVKWILEELRQRNVELEQQGLALRQSQRALARSRDDYAELYEVATVGYLTLDSKGTILKNNLATAALVAMAGSTIDSLPFASFVVEADRPLFAAFLEQIFQQPFEKRSCQLRLVTAGGGSACVRLDAQPGRAGESCLVAIAEVTTSQDKEKFHIVADNTYAWEFWLDPEGNFIYVSPSCKPITGYDASDFLADPTLFYRIIHPEDRSCFNDLGLRSPGAGAANFEYRIIDRHGAVRWIHHVCHNIVAHDGRNQGTRGSNRDITDEYLLKRRLISSYKDLETLTAELNLSEERERRRIALRLHDQVVQALALANMNLDAALQKGEIAEHRLLREVQDTLKISMGDLRELSADLSPPVLYDLGLSAALATLGSSLEKKFGLRVDFAADCPDIGALNQELTICIFQFCRELLMNVIKHARATTATIRLSQRGSQLAFSVRDDGTGFDSSNYRQGFGLASIRQRVGYLGGEFRMASAIGAGTCANISLDIALPTPQ